MLLLVSVVAVSAFSEDHMPLTVEEVQVLASNNIREDDAIIQPAMDEGYTKEDERQNGVESAKDASESEINVPVSFLDVSASNAKENVKQDEHKALTDLLDGIERRLMGSFAKSWDSTVGAATRNLQKHEELLKVFTSRKAEAEGDLSTVRRDLDAAKKEYEKQVAANQHLKDKMSRQLKMIYNIRNMLHKLSYEVAVWQGYSGGHEYAQPNSWRVVRSDTTRYSLSNDNFEVEGSGYLTTHLDGVWELHLRTLSHVPNAQIYYLHHRVMQGSEVLSTSMWSWYIAWKTNMTTLLFDAKSGHKFNTRIYQSNHHGNNNQYYQWHGGYHHMNYELRYVGDNDGKYHKRTWKYTSTALAQKDWGQAGWKSYPANIHMYSPTSKDKDSYWRKNSDGTFFVDITGIYRILWNVTSWVNSKSWTKSDANFPVRRAYRIVYCAKASDNGSCKTIHAENTMSPWGNSNVLDYPLNAAAGSSFTVQTRIYSSLGSHPWYGSNGEYNSLAITFEGQAEGSKRARSLLAGCRKSKDDNFVQPTFGNYMHYSSYTDSKNRKFNEWFFRRNNHWVPACTNTISHDTFGKGGITANPDGTICVNLSGFYRVFANDQTNFYDCDGKRQGDFNHHYSIIWVKRPGKAIKESNSDDWGHLIAYGNHNNYHLGTLAMKTTMTIPLTAGQCFGITHLDTGYNNGYSNTIRSEFNTINMDLGDGNNIGSNGYGSSYVHVEYIGPGGDGTKSVPKPY